MMSSLIELLIRSCIETFYITGMIILTGLLLGILRTYSIRNLQRSFGSKAVMITGFIGVPIHELSHAVFAVLFGHKVTKIKLLQKPDENGTMGYVNHSYNKLSIYQQIGNFFIGIAPILGGASSIIVLMRYMLPLSYNEFIKILMENFHLTTLNKSTMEGMLSSYAALISTVFSFGNLKNPAFYIFLFTAICISSHISLSYADMKGAFRGIGAIFMILFILNLFDLSKYIAAVWIIRYNILLTGVLIAAVLLSGITFIVSLILFLVKQGLS
jgi:hypothetical protein